MRLPAAFRYRLGRDARAAIPVLRELEKSSDPILRLTASQALKKIDPARVKEDP